jgi:nucleoside-diphosphate-sugar epimerase
LITGGLGFIGLSLAEELSGLGYKVTLLDIADNNKDIKLYEKDKNIDFIQCDTNSYNSLVELFNNSEFSGIIHLAAVSRVVVAQNNPDECIRTNINGTRTLLRALEGSQTQKNRKPWLIFGSSREVYGEPKELPVKESFEKRFVNIYGDSKIQGENMFINYAKKNSNSCLILRFANVYGNEYDLIDRVIPRFIQAIAFDRELTIEGGGQIIDFTHIDDTINTIIKAIEYLNINRDKNITDDFHILPGIGWSLYQLIESIENILDKKAIIKVNLKKDYDAERFIGDPTKIRTILKSRDFLSLEEGLRLAIPRYLKVLK